jgi:hypothetical protein
MTPVLYVVFTRVREARNRFNQWLLDRPKLRWLYTLVIFAVPYAAVMPALGSGSLPQYAFAGVVIGVILATYDAWINTKGEW